MKQLNNQTRLAMAQNSNPKVTTLGNVTIYTVGNVVVSDRGELEFGSDSELWTTYKLTN